jgi:membrane protein YqaA with SNARE-associated domain
MWWQYVLVLLSTIAVDITPLPLPPAFTVMVFFQIVYGLPIWPVVLVGVMGCIIGRYILTLYIPRVSDRIFIPSKTEDIRFLGEKLKHNGWKSQLFILLFTLMPLPSTPLFIAGGIARMKPIQIIPAFFVGKFTSDSIAVFMGEYATANAGSIIHGLFTWKSLAGLLLGCSWLFALVFIDWRRLMTEKKLRLTFRVWKH